MKLRNDRTKLASPAVSVRGQLARCVSCQGSVRGRAIATTATYAHPAKPYIARARARALKIRLIGR